MATFSATDWNEATRARPVTAPAAAARSLSARSARSSSASACPASTYAASVSRTPRPGRLEQRHARLALQHGELLRDRRRRELERFGHRGDRASVVQLAQQAQSAQVQHRISNATEY